MQTRNKAQQRHAAMSQAIGLPSYHPTPLLLVATAEQEVQLEMLLLVGVIVALCTMWTLALIDYRILHSSPSHPWNGELFIQNYPKTWKLFLNDRLRSKSVNSYGTMA